MKPLLFVLVLFFTRVVKAQNFLGYGVSRTTKISSEGAYNSGVSVNGSQVLNSLQNNICGSQKRYRTYYLNFDIEYIYLNDAILNGGVFFERLGRIRGYDLKWDKERLFVKQLFRNSIGYVEGIDFNKLKRVNGIEFRTDLVKL